MEEEPTTSAGSNAELFIRALEYKQLVTKMRRSSLAATRDMKPGRIRKVDKFETENPSVPGDRKLSYKIDRSESKLECKLSPTMKTATFLITGKAWERKLIKSPLPTSEYEGKSSLSIKTEKISSKVKLLQGTPTTAPSKSVWVRGKKEESPTVDTSCPELTVQLKRVGFKKAIVPVERLCLIDYEFTSCDSLTVEMEKTLIKFVRCMEKASLPVPLEFAVQLASELAPNCHFDQIWWQRFRKFHDLDATAPKDYNSQPRTKSQDTSGHLNLIKSRKLER